MNYSYNPKNCRVDVFKESGKWYDTIVLTMNEKPEELIHDTFKRCMNEQHPTWMKDHEGFSLVCLEPYHTHSHPIMIRL